MPSLKDQLQSDLTEAIRAQNDVVRSTLRLALTAITRAEVAGETHTTLTDDQVLGLLGISAGNYVVSKGIQLK